MDTATATTYVIVGQSYASDGFTSRNGDWYSDGTQYRTLREATKAKDAKYKRERRAGNIWSSRGGHVGRGYIFRIWTAEEYRTFQQTRREPFGGGI